MKRTRPTFRAFLLQKGKETFSLFRSLLSVMVIVSSKVTDTPVVLSSVTPLKLILLKSIQREDKEVDFFLLSYFHSASPTLPTPEPEPVVNH